VEHNTCQSELALLKKEVSELKKRISKLEETCVVKIPDAEIPLAASTVEELDQFVDMPGIVSTFNKKEFAKC